MNWIEQVTILDLLLKGLIIGIVVSAPLGPVGVLCIQRTLNKGRWFGFVTGVGAALSDICYALITGYGMSFMDELILKHHIFLQVVGRTHPEASYFSSGGGQHHAAGFWYLYLPQ